MDYYRWYEYNSKKWEKVENAIANPPEFQMSWGISERDKEACRNGILDFIENKSIKEVVCGHTWGRVHYFYRGDNGKYYSYAYKENKVQTCEEVSEEIIKNYGLPFCFDEGDLEDRIVELDKEQKLDELFEKIVENFEGVVVGERVIRK